MIPESPSTSADRQRWVKIAFAVVLAGFVVCGGLGTCLLLATLLVAPAGS